MEILNKHDICYGFQEITAHVDGFGIGESGARMNGDGSGYAGHYDAGHRMRYDGDGFGNGCDHNGKDLESGVGSGRHTDW